MSRYLIADVAEAEQAARKLRDRGFTVSSEDVPDGFLLTVAGPPSVDAEETLIAHAPSVRHLTAFGLV